MSFYIKCIFSLVLGFTLLYDLCLPLHPDEAYYWDWSRHLDLSYYDGPPLIAYLIRGFTFLLGERVLVIKLVSIVCLSLTLFLIYELAEYLFNKKVAEKAFMLALFLPFIQGYFLASTYDAPQFLFWIATLLYFCKAIYTEHPPYLYWAGFTGGLLLLSKYTGILLFVSLFFYLLFSKHRYFFKNLHLYGAILLSFFLFSPVLIWNIEHHWISFIYQASHGVSQWNGFTWPALKLFLLGQMVLFNPIFFIVLLFFLVFNSKRWLTDLKLYYLAWPFFFTFLFFFYFSCFSRGEANWALPAYLSGTLLLAYFIQDYRMDKLYRFILLFAAAMIIFLKLPALTPFVEKNKGALNAFLGYRELINELNVYYTPPIPVFTNNARDAAMAAFYLKGRPSIYMLGDGVTNQYTLWTKSLKWPVQKAWYMDNPDYRSSLPFLKQRFLMCKETGRLTYFSPFVDRHRKLYFCSN